MKLYRAKPRYVYATELPDLTWRVRLPSGREIDMSAADFVATYEPLLAEEITRARR